MLHRLWHVKNEHIKSLRRQKKNPDDECQGSFLIMRLSDYREITVRKSFND